MERGLILYVVHYLLASSEGEKENPSDTRHFPCFTRLLRDLFSSRAE